MIKITPSSREPPNWVTYMGRVKITEESSYFLSIRETSLSTSLTHVLFDFLRRLAPSFVIWRQSGEKGKENLSCSALFFPTAFERRKPLYFSTADRTSLIYPVISANALFRIRFNNAWKNYHPEPETLAACKTLEFPKSFLASLTYFLHGSLQCH